MSIANEDNILAAEDIDPSHEGEHGEFLGSSLAPDADHDLPSSLRQAPATSTSVDDTESASSRPAKRMRLENLALGADSAHHAETGALIDDYLARENKDLAAAQTLLNSIATPKMLTEMN